MYEIQEIRKFCTLQKYRNELEDTKDKTTVLKLKNIIKELDNKKEKEKDGMSAAQKDLNKMFVDINRYVYKKPWAKLPEFHKLVKIREYIDKLMFKSEKNKMATLEDLMEDVRARVLTKKNTVNYDQTNAQIISIKGLDYDKKSNGYIYKKAKVK